MTRRTSSFDAGPSVETEAGSRRLQDIPTAHTTSSVALSSEVDSAPRRQFDPASTDDSSSTLESLPTPSSPRLGPAGDMDTPISSFGDLPLPWPPASDDGDATPTIQRMRAAEEQALSFARTRRFKWIAVEEGGKLVDYIVSGHQGELHRCEDEAIGAPGAVQAFGVLIAFDQEIDGRLVVQQVSENSGSLLGLDPHQLLSSASLAFFLPEEAILDIVDQLEIFDQCAGPICEPLSFVINGGHWKAYAIIHRPAPATQPKRAILELEPVDDKAHPCTPRSSFRQDPFASEADAGPSLERQTSFGHLRTLRSWRHKSQRYTRSGQSRDLDVLKVVAEAQRHFNAQTTLEPFLKLVAEMFHDITGFARTMIYKFDDSHNGQVVEEIISSDQPRDSYLNLNWPAGDIPPQARELYRLNKTRMVYDVDSPTARMCCRSIEEINTPLNMAHSYLRALSPIHVHYLKQMDVKSSMSVSLIANNQLWGLIALHDFGPEGRRVSPPLRQLCRLVGESASTHLERILLKERVEGRKIVEQSQHRTGGYVATPEEMLDVFDADSAALCINSGVKLIGRVEDSQEILAIVKWLKENGFNSILHTHELIKDFPEILVSGERLHDIAGFLAVPLSGEGKDFMAFFRRAELKEIRWAGNPYRGTDAPRLEPRASFELWKEQVTGQSRPWTIDQLEACGLVGLVYGKFAAVWKEKREQERRTRHRDLLLENAGHAARTPLNAILNHLEVALEESHVTQGPLRESLAHSASATRSLINVINDLLELTHASSHDEGIVGEPIDLAALIEESTATWRVEALRKGVNLILRPSTTSPVPPRIVCDPSYVRKIVSSLVSNATENTQVGSVIVEWGRHMQVTIVGDRSTSPTESKYFISVTDTGVGMTPQELEAIFRDLENVTTVGDSTDSGPGVGLGIAITSRIVRKLGGQLRIESTPGSGTCVHVALPLYEPTGDRRDISVKIPAERREVDALVTVMLQSHLRPSVSEQQVPTAQSEPISRPTRPPLGREPRRPGLNPVQSTSASLGPGSAPSAPLLPGPSNLGPRERSPLTHSRQRSSPIPSLPPYPDSERVILPIPPLKIVVVEDDAISRQILTRRLERDGNSVIPCEHGDVCLEALERDPEQDLVLMDLQMPIKDGLATTTAIRRMEVKGPISSRIPVQLNGRLPILAVSAQIDLVGGPKLVKTGFDGVVEKPVNFDRLRSMLAGVVDPGCRQDMYWRAPARPTRGGCWFHDARHK